MNFSIQEVFSDGVVVQSSKDGFGITKIHVQVLGKLLPQLADGTLEAVATAEDVSYVNGRVNEMAIMFGMQSIHEGTASYYDAGMLPNFGEEGEVQVYLVAIDEGDGNTAFAFTTETSVGDGDVFSSFSVETAELAEVGALLAGVDFDAEGLVTQREAYEAQAEAAEATQH